LGKHTKLFRQPFGKQRTKRQPAILPMRRKLLILNNLAPDALLGHSLHAPAHLPLSARRPVRIGPPALIRRPRRLA